MSPINNTPVYTLAVRIQKFLDAIALVEYCEANKVHRIKEYCKRAQK